MGELMTDNEKAATFVGWRPDAQHYGAPPDMSEPNNYMRAFASLAADSKYVQLTNYRAEGSPIWGHITITDQMPKREGIRQPPDPRIPLLPVAWASKRTMGEAAVNALAALYEVEHPDGK